MNAALILSGGAGRRFNSELPKQYHRIGGKMLIEYVLAAAFGARGIDTVVVAGHDCAALARLARAHSLNVAPGGARRNDTLKNGLDYLKARACENVVILDAVRPMVTSELIDAYIGFLHDGYDAVSTAQPITDSLGCYDMHAVDRSRYYLMQSPEAYRFEPLYDCFNCDSPLTEVAQQLPEDIKLKLYFDFPENPKLTYPWEKAYIAQALKARAHK